MKQQGSRMPADVPVPATPHQPASPPEPTTPSPDGADEHVRQHAMHVSPARPPRPVRLDQAAEAVRELGGFVWCDVLDPTPGTFEQIARAFALPPLAVKGAVQAQQRPKLEVHGDVLFAVLTPIRYVDSAEVVQTSQIAVFLGATFVVTVRHGASDALDGLRRDLDDARPGQPLLSHGPSGVLHAAADRVVDAYEDVADAIDVDIEQIEAEVFGGNEDDHAQRIYRLKREVLEFRRAVAPLDRPLQRLSEAELPEVPAAMRPFFRDVHDRALRAAERVEGHDRLLSDVLAADLAQVSVRQNRTAVRQNEDMRRISAWAAIALVPTAVAGIYGMNFEHMPELGWRFGYPVVLAAIVVVCLLLARLFRRNGWL